jgi:hypothetical protein
MLMCNQMISPDSGADFALPGMVASSPQFRVFVISQLDLTLIWRSREQR